MEDPRSERIAADSPEHVDGCKVVLKGASSSCEPVEISSIRICSNTDLSLCARQAGASRALVDTPLLFAYEQDSPYSPNQLQPARHFFGAW
jgi:hypothetical protein